MSSKAASKRLSKEFVAMQKEPPPYVWAAPEERDILTWHYIIRGPPDSPYAGGEYHGLILFPPEYPFKPPGIKMLTPSGRFQPDRRICFSMSDFHPGTWNPAWSVATILTGLLSFMLSEEMTTGSLTSTDEDKRALAAKSHVWNIKQKRFRDMFPDYSQETMKDLPSMGQKERGVPDQPPTSSKATDSSISGAMPLQPVEQSVTRSKVTTAQQPPPQVDEEPGWAATWGHYVWNKWRWALIIGAAVILSRVTSGS